MKWSLAIPLSVILIVVAINSAFSMQSTILEKRNEFGGRTEEERYFPEDEKYKDGLSKLVQYFDGNNRIIRLESFFNESRAMIDGVERSVQYFDNRFYRSGIRTRVEFIYSDAYAASEGLAKAIQYYDEDEKRIKIDYFYTDSFATKHHTARLETLYDPKGHLVKRTYFDKDGKILSSESPK